MTGLYVHIPFCRRKCAYCDFSSIPSAAGVPDWYGDAVRREMRRYEGRVIDTVYIGGGTPSLMHPAQLQALGNDIFSSFAVTPGAEMTIEVNPESLTPDMPDVLVDMGVTRVSMGVQSLDDADLRTLGRPHGAVQAEEAYARLRAAGIASVSVDLMFGIPGQSLDAWGRTLAAVIAWAPDHMSAYGLTVEPGTPFARAGVVVDSDLQAGMYERAQAMLAAGGYRQYEISNWAKPGQESRHNMNYWRGGTYLGIGASAVSCDGSVRRTNAREPSVYHAALAAGNDPSVDKECLDERTRTAESFMLGLRCTEGIRLTSAQYGRFASVIDRFVGEGLMEYSDGAIRLTPRGLLLSNHVIQEFL